MVPSGSWLGAAIALAILAVLVLRTIEGWLRHIPMPITWDYGPAQLAIHVDMMIRGIPLYRDFRLAPFMPLVYGPIVPTITAMLSAPFGAGAMAALEAGRALTIGSTLLVSMAIFLLARRIGTSRAGASLATLAFILSPIVMRWGGEFRVDMPMLACELGGIVAFAGGATPVAIALFAAAFYIKPHALGIATVVVFCWISGQRRRAVMLAMVWGALIAATTALLATIYPYYLLNTFVAVRTLRLDLGAPPLFFSVLIGGNVGLVIFTIAAIARRRVTDRMMLCLLVLAPLHDLASSLRWGSNAYYFLPTLAAISIIGSGGIDLALARMREMGTPAQATAGMALALVLSLGFFLTPRAFAATAALPDPWDHRAIDMLDSIKGPILTDRAELKLVDSQPNLQWIDLMVLASMEQLGTFNDQPLLEAIRRHQIAAFALDEDGLGRSFRGRSLFWPALRREIQVNYEVVPAIGPPYLMIPKRTRQNTKTPS